MTSGWGAAGMTRVFNGLDMAVRHARVHGQHKLDMFLFFLLVLGVGWADVEVLGSECGLQYGVHVKLPNNQ